MRSSRTLANVLLPVATVWPRAPRECSDADEALNNALAEVEDTAALESEGYAAWGTPESDTLPLALFQCRYNNERNEKKVIKEKVLPQT